MHDDRTEPSVTDSLSDSLPSRAPADQGSGNKGSREQGSNSSPVRQSGLVDARETGQTDDNTFLAVYSIGDNRLVRLSSYANSINAVMQQFRWATLERGTGWYFAEPYLARVELALLGVGVRMANRDGSPTPCEVVALRKGERRQSERVLAELAEAREAALADPAAVRDARRECRTAFDAAVHRTPEEATR